MQSIIAATGSQGATPMQTLSRVLQELRDTRRIEFVGDGVYRYAGQPVIETSTGPSKGVFVTGAHSIYDDEPEAFYRFPPNYLAAARRMVGEWIVYLEPRRAGGRGFWAVAKVSRIERDLARPGMFLAVIEPGTFLEFGTDVPFSLDKLPMERSLLNPDGTVKGSKQLAVRSLSNADFNRIVEIGLMDPETKLPRVDATELPQTGDETRGDRVGAIRQTAYHVELVEQPVDRATMLVNRKVRDAKFRRAVLHAYQGRCALTGIRLVNGGGRLETEAAHIKSVADGGPDKVNNGIALSGTVHWMFDRGLISVSDAGDILLSSKINDQEGVEKLIFADKKARLPLAAAIRSHPRYLDWHRSNCFHG
jgi:putative restriction endonuclease